MHFSHERSIPESLREYGRGIAGGLLFALPLVFTMELWDRALMTTPEKLAVYLIATFLLLLLYNRFAGLRKDATFSEVAIDSVEELGLGLLISFAALYLLGRIGPEQTLYEITNRVLVEGMTLALGVSVGTAQLGTEDANNAGGMDGDDDGETAYSYLAQSAIAFCGAILFASNIAPTEEVGILARDASVGRLVLTMLISLLLGLGILYFTAFRGTVTNLPKREWKWITREIITAYAASLAAAALILYLFETLPSPSPTQFVAAMIVIGFPAMLGASAGRLLLQLDH